MSKGDYLGEFEQLVLLAIAHQGESGYGVTILDEIRERTGRAPSIGAVYATLARLENKGLVRSWLGPTTGERGGRARRFFALRPAGVRELESSRRALEQMWSGLEWKPRAEGA
jgi:PadR family transcriptional regulator, regulatory protein PadR